MVSKFGNLRVLVVEDDPLILRNIGAVAARSSTLAVVGEAFNGADGVARFQALRPDVVLVDIHVPRTGGVEVIERIRALSTTVTVIAFGAHRVDAMVDRVMAAGAQAFLITTALAVELPATVERLAVGTSAPRGGRASKAGLPGSSVALTEREVEVLRGVAAGQTNREIATLLTISDETVKGHMKNISAKLGARHRAEAVALAYRQGLLGL